MVGSQGKKKHNLLLKASKYYVIFTKNVKNVKILLNSLAKSRNMY